jgi:uncharacterized membrane protein
MSTVVYHLGIHTYYGTLDLHVRDFQERSYRVNGEITPVCSRTYTAFISFCVAVYLFVFKQTYSQIWQGKSMF